MPEYKYLIIGGGMTGDSAVKGIRGIDREGSIGVISMETHPPYNRPPLSKDLWKGKPEEKIWRKTDEHNAELTLGTRAVSLYADHKRIKDDKGEEYKFDKLLLATGGTPIRLLPRSAGSPTYGGNEIIYFRTFDDYQRLRDLAETKKRFAVIGGGFIGSEIAAALAMNGREVVMIFPSEAIGSKMFPPDLAEYVNDYYRNKGVEVMSGESVENVEFRSQSAEVKLKSGKHVEADAVVAGLGIKPNIELAESANIKTDNGIVVDEFLRTNYPYIYAAGDAANFYNPALGERIRVEHEDNANKMGRHAGEVMAGEEKPYHHLPFFYSDMFELGYEAVGDLNPSYEIYPDWSEEYKEGVVYYLSREARDGNPNAGRVKGVLLWNIFGQVNAARELIADKGPFKPESLKGRLGKKK